MPEPSRGEIWLVDLNPVRGHEKSGRRPGLVISVNGLNYGAAGLVVIIPITTKAKGIPFHVEVSSYEGGLEHTSFIKCEDLRSISKDRLVSKFGKIEEDTLANVEDRLRILLGL
jgi:mRNA interferase MazF